MRDWFTETDIAACAVALVLCLRLWQRSTGWQRRFGTIRSPLLQAPAYRALFIVVLIGVLLVSSVPEAAFMLPALDIIGLDIVTIMAALELRHYLASAARFVGMPTSAAGYVRAAIQVMRHYGSFLRTNPVLWLYACMWPVIWIRTLKGTMTVAPTAQA